MVQAGIDAVAWAVALTFATIIRWNFSWSSIDYGGLLAIIPLAVLAQVVAGIASGIYLGRWRFGSFEEVEGLVRAAAITTVLLLLVDLWVIRNVRMIPISAAVAGGVVAFALMGAARYVWRLRSSAGAGQPAATALAFSCSAPGTEARRSSRPCSATRRVPMCPSPCSTTILASPTFGSLASQSSGRAHLSAAALRYQVGALLIAIPSAGGALSVS